MQKSASLSSWSWITKSFQGLKVTTAGRQAENAASEQIVQHRTLVTKTRSQIDLPEKPKRPLSPYMRYLMAERDQAAKKNPTLKPTELVSLISKNWNSLNNEVKDPYINAFRNEIASYQSAMETYKNSLSHEQIEMQQQLKLEKQIKKEKTQRRKRVKELGKPRKPMSGFFRFLQETVEPTGKMESFKVAARECGQKWKGMTEAEKEPYLVKYKKDLEKYNKDLKEWENEMLKNGNEDLVRQLAVPKVKKRQKKAE